MSFPDTASLGTGSALTARSGPEPVRDRDPRFAQTHWSVVLAVREGDPARAGEALERLCRTYWYPLYAYIRRKGHGPEEASDLTQEFFLRLLQSNFLSRVDRTKGKFRSFLLGALEHFLAKEWRRAHRQKRGGGCEFVSLEAEQAEGRYRFEPAHELTAEALYNQVWALMLLERAMAATQAESTATGKSRLFNELKALLDGNRSEAPYAEIAARLGMGEGAVRMAAHRLRARYGEFLRAEIAQTVGSPDSVDEEIRFLVSSLH